MELPNHLIEKTLPTYKLVARVIKNDKNQLIYLKKDKIENKWIESIDKRRFEDIDLQFKTSKLTLKEQISNYTIPPNYQPLHLKHLRMGCKLFLNVGFMIIRNSDNIPYINRFFINPEQIKIKQNVASSKNRACQGHKK